MNHSIVKILSEMFFSFNTYLVYILGLLFNCIYQPLLQKFLLLLVIVIT